VAQRVVGKLGLHDSISNLLATYTVMNLTDRVLELTASATSSKEAVLQANTLATEFLQLRADRLQAQQQLTVAALDQQISQARQNLTALTTQIAALSAQPASHDQQAKLSQLNSQRSDAQTALVVLQQTTAGNKATGQANVAAQVKGSSVLDPATAMHHSPAKFAIIYAVIGLIVGLALGLAIVIIRALVSNRLRRRDDIADALGATVNLSVGRISSPRWHLERPKLKAARDRDLARIVAHLRDAVPEGSSGAAALAVVAIDNEKSAAQSLVSLAASCAQQGHQVLVADLCPGAPAAHLLGAANPGIQKVTVDGVPLDVAVGRRDDVMPTGPVHPGRMRTPEELPGEALAAAYHSADILLTLIALDPSLGAEHLRTWAADAVVVVTAGRSSWLRIHAVGEMIRLARIRLVSAILVGADKTDESLGITQTAARGSAAARIGGL
jgi:capsular polysaccharide biosynthesis protein